MSARVALRGDMGGPSSCANLMVLIYTTRVLEFKLKLYPFNMRQSLFDESIPIMRRLPVSRLVPLAGRAVCNGSES